jgi:WD40 repeat protein
LHSGAQQAVERVTFALSGRRFATSFHEGTLKVWQTSNGECLHSHKTPKRSSSVSLSPDGRFLAHASTDFDVRVRDLDAGTDFNFGDGDYCATAFSPCGRLLAMATAEVICVWNSQSRTVQSEVNSESTTLLSFSPDSRLLASVQRKCVIEVWDHGSNTFTSRLDLECAVRQLAFCPAGIQLSTDRGVLFVDPPAEHTAPQQTARRQVNALTQPYVGNTWVSFSAKNFLRLPSEYKSSICNVHGSTIAFGLHNGKIIIINFEASKMRNAGHACRPRYSYHWRPHRRDYGSYEMASSHTQDADRKYGWWRGRWRWLIWAEWFPVRFTHYPYWSSLENIVNSVGKSVARVTQP